MDLEEIFLKFRRLDEEKIGFGLAREDENDWYIYHNIIMTKIFLEPYGALLDKRKFIRVPTALPIEYKIEKEKIHTIVQNIGVGGVSVPLNPRVSVGDVLQVKFHVGKTKIAEKSKLRWTHQKINQMGLEFLDFPIKKTAAIASYVYDIIESKLGEVLSPIDINNNQP